MTMKIAVFAVLPASLAAVQIMTSELTARGHKAFGRNLAAFDGQSEGADMYMLMLEESQAKSFEPTVKRFIDLFDHKVKPVSLKATKVKGSSRPVYTVVDQEDVLSEFGSSAQAPAEKLNVLQAKAIGLGVPFDSSTTAEDLALAIEQAGAVKMGEDEDGETDEQQQLRQRLEALPDDEIRKVAKDEFDGKTFPGNARTETMINGLVAALAEQSDD